MCDSVQTETECGSWILIQMLNTKFNQDWFLSDITEMKFEFQHGV